MARATIARAHAQLPRPLAAKVRHVAIQLERRPTGHWAAKGVESDTMGLFQGESLAEQDATDSILGPEIILFLDNIWDEADHNARVFREEVERTYLHELGHYLGLDEDGLAVRGLE